MPKLSKVYIDTNILKFSATRLFCYRPRRKIIKWGGIAQEVTVHDPVYINPNEGISNPMLKYEAELLVSVAELAKQGLINLVFNVETAFESWGIPNMASESGRFYGAPIKMIESPIKHSRVLIGAGYDTETLQMDFLTGIKHPRFKELIKLTGAYQGKHGYNKNQLLDAFHLWCAESSGCDYFLTLDFKLIRYVQNNKNISINTELIVPSELLERLGTEA